MVRRRITDQKQKAIRKKYNHLIKKLSVLNYKRIKGTTNTIQILSRSLPKNKLILKI